MQFSLFYVHYKSPPAFGCTSHRCSRRCGSSTLSYTCLHQVDTCLPFSVFNCNSDSNKKVVNSWQCLETLLIVISMLRTVLVSKSFKSENDHAFVYFLVLETWLKVQVTWIIDGLQLARVSTTCFT